MKLSNLFYVLGLAAVAVSANEYLGSRNADQERNGLFLGHWAPTFLILGKIVEDRELRGKNIISGA